MTKAEFYKELKNVGVDTGDPAQMKVWSLALLRMGQEYIDHRFDRCEDCYYRNRAVDNGQFSMERCPNRFCPIKRLPNNPAEVVDHLFQQNFPLDIGAFFNKYVDPILTELSRQEEERKNAGEHNR